MANLAIRNLDNDVKRRLRVRAAEHHRSMEEEVRIILRNAVKGERTGPGIWRSSRGNASHLWAA